MEIKLKCTYSVDNYFTVGEFYEVFEIRKDVEELNKYYFVIVNNHNFISPVVLNGNFWKFEIVKEEEEMEEAKLLTGLEAIELMKQGKTVIEVFEEEGFDALIFKIVDGNVCHKLPQEDDGEYEVDWGFDFTTKYKEYIEPKPKSLTGWERVDECETYHLVSCKGVHASSDYKAPYDDSYYNQANYFSTKEKAEEIAFKQTLFRKLQRFSDENGGNEVDWENDKQLKYYVYYDRNEKELYIDYTWREYVGVPYFVSIATANQAIELFHDDLIKYFTM